MRIPSRARYSVPRVRSRRTPWHHPSVTAIGPAAGGVATMPTDNSPGDRSRAQQTQGSTRKYLSLLLQRTRSPTRGWRSDRPDTGLWRFEPPLDEGVISPARPRSSGRCGHPPTTGWLDTMRVPQPVRGGLRGSVGPPLVYPMCKRAADQNYPIRLPSLCAPVNPTPTDDGRDLDRASDPCRLEAQWIVCVPM